MPEYLAPGVFVEEVSFRPKSIEGVGTSTTAFAGPAPRGPLFLPAGTAGAPLDGVPEVLTSYGEFERLYGGYGNLVWASGTTPAINHIALAVKAFFDNGGARLYFARTFMPGAGSGIAASDPVTGAVAFRARFPGSGYNGTITARERRTPASPASLAGASDGALLRVGGGNAAQPAILQATLPQAGFGVSNNGALRLQVGTPATAFTVTFQGTPAAAVAQASLPVSLVVAPGGTTLAVTVNGAPQTIAIAAGSYAPTEVLAAVNAGLRAGAAYLDAGRLAIRSDREGTSAAVSVTQHNDLGFTDATTAATGTGNVADLAAVTVGDLNTLLHAVGVAAPVTASLVGGLLTLTTDAAGGDARIQVDGAVANSAHAAFNLPVTAVTGTAGTTPQYYVKVPAVGWRTGLGLATPLPASPTAPELVSISIETVDKFGTVTAWEDLGLHSAHPRYIGEVLKKLPNRRAEALSNPYWLDLAGSSDVLALRQGLTGSLGTASFVVRGGNDGVEPPAATDQAGAVSYENAFGVLGQIDDIAIVAAPGHSAFGDTTFQAIQQALITHAENLRYRIAVLDTPPGITPSQAREVRSRIDSTRAAIYYPWVVVANPLARPGVDTIPKEIALPPSGFVTGVYARTDISRGVWKAPANEVVRGALRFELEINKGVNEVLNPEGVNCLRSFSGRGQRVWGARTATTDPEWKYVSVRRYFIYLERSIDVSTQWAVFEPNGEALWANISETVSAFLYNEWRNGALLGGKPEEAYFVRCDRSTMTQNDLDNGRLICQIGVAALKPAEFVIFRIGQKTADARQ